MLISICRLSLFQNHLLIHLSVWWFIHLVIVFYLLFTYHLVLDFTFTYTTLENILGEISHNSVLISLPAIPICGRDWSSSRNISLRGPHFVNLKISLQWNYNWQLSLKCILNQTWIKALIFYPEIFKIHSFREQMLVLFFFKCRQPSEMSDLQMENRISDSTTYTWTFCSKWNYLSLLLLLHY